MVSFLLGFSVSLGWVAMLLPFYFILRAFNSSISLSD